MTTLIVLGAYPFESGDFVCESRRRNYRAPRIINRQRTGNAL